MAKSYKSYEIARFAQLKTPVHVETKKKIAQAKDEVAGQSHLAAPGHLAWMLMQAEHEHKMQLTEANLQVLEETQGMHNSWRQYELERDGEIARMEFDQWQQQLFLDLERENREAQLQREMDEVALTDMRTENRLRQIIIDEAQKQIQMELEEARQAVLPYRESVSHKEVELTGEQYITLQKRLEVIPHIKKFLEKQFDVVEARTELLGYQEELLPYRLQIAEWDLEIAEKDIEIAESRLYIAQRYTELYAAQMTTAELQKAAILKQYEIHEIRQQVQATQSETVQKLLQVVEKEAEVIAAEELVRDKRRQALEYEGIAIEKAGEVIDVQSELIDHELEILNKNQEFQNARHNLIDIQKSLIQKRHDYLDHIKDRRDKQIEVYQMETEIAEVNKRVIEAQEQFLEEDLKKIQAENVRMAAIEGRIEAQEATLEKRGVLDDVLRTTIDKQEYALGYEIEAAEKQEDLADKRMQVAETKQQKLLPAMHDRLDALTNLVNTQMKYLDDQKDLIKYQIKRSLLAEDRADAEKEISAARLGQIQAETSLQLFQTELQVEEEKLRASLEKVRASVAKTNASSIPGYLWSAAESAEDAQDANFEASQYGRDLRSKTNKDVNVDLYKERVNTIKSNMAEQINQRRAQHDAQVNAQITQNLTHLLGAS